MNMNCHCEERSDEAIPLIRDCFVTRFARTRNDIKFALLFIFVLGCSKPPAPLITLTEAEQKFKKLCAEEYKLNVSTRMVNKTLWIYLPIKNNILAIKATEDGPTDTGESKESMSLRYIDGKFENGQFVIAYDVGKTKTYSKQFGYTSAYADEYQKMQSNILLTLQRSYFDLPSPPEFVVLVVSDIVTGIEVESVIYFEDLKRAMSLIPSIPQDEFTKRYLTQLRGQITIIGDETGKHLQYREMNLPEFLARQIAYRVSFKYQQSSILPMADAKTEITAIVRETLAAYKFQGFEAVVLKDLDRNTAEEISKEKI